MSCIVRQAWIFPNEPHSGFERVHLLVDQETAAVLLRHDFGKMCLFLAQFFLPLASGRKVVGTAVAGGGWTAISRLLALLRDHQGGCSASKRSSGSRVRRVPRKNGPEVRSPVARCRIFQQRVQSPREAAWPHDRDEAGVRSGVEPSPAFTY